MPQPAVAAEVHQPLDVHGHFAPQVPFDHVVAVDDLADLQHFLVGQLRYPAGLRNPDFPHDFIGLSRPDAMDILQCNNDAFVGRYVDAGDAGHSLSLLLPARAGPAILPREAVPKRYRDTLPVPQGPVSFDLSTWMRVIKGFNVVSSTSALNPFCAGATCGPRPCRGRIWPFWPSFSTPWRIYPPARFLLRPPAMAWPALSWEGLTKHS